MLDTKRKLATAVGVARTEEHGRETAETDAGQARRSALQATEMAQEATRGGARLRARMFVGALLQRVGRALAVVWTWG